MKTLAWAMLILSVISVVAGRFATFHCTEMEALVAGWPYWLSAFGCAVLGMSLTLRCESD